MAMTSTWPDSLQLKRSSPDAKLDVVVLVLAKTCLQWFLCHLHVFMGVTRTIKGERERGGGERGLTPLFTY